MALKDLKRYQYGNIAGELAKAEQFQAAGISLEKLASDMGISRDAEGFIRGTQMSKEGIARASSIYSKKWEDFYKNSNVGDLWSLYSEKCSNDGEKRVFGAKVTQYFDKKIKDIADSLKKRKEKLKKLIDNKETASDDEIRGINSEINSYQEALGLINGAEELYKTFLMEEIQKDLTNKQREDIKENMKKIVGL